MSTATTTRPKTTKVKDPGPITGRLTATVAAGDLTAALRAALRFVDLRRPAVPVLGGVVLSGSRGVLTVKAFDYRRLYVQDVAAPGASGGLKGAVLVEAARLLDRVAVFGRRDDLTLTVEGTSLIIHGPDVRYRMPLMPLEDYPTLPEVEGQTITLTEADRTNILKVAASAGTDGMLPILTTLHLSAKARGLIEVYSTDRYRLGRAILSAKARTALSVAIPADALVKGLSTLARIPGPVTLRVDTPKADALGAGQSGLAVTEGWASLRTGAHQITTRTGSGIWPSIKGIISADERPLAIHVDADALIDAVRKAAVGAPRNCPVRILVNTRTRAVTLTAGSMDPGYDLTVDVPAAKVKGKPSVLLAERSTAEKPGDTLQRDGLGLNPAYLLEALRTFAGQTVQLQVLSNHKPLLLASDEAPDYQHVLMPVRLAG